MSAQAEEVRRLRERIEGHEGPMLSVYLSVNSRYPENQGQAYKVRLKDALKELEEASEELTGHVWEEVEGETRPGARTLVFFVGEDGFFERYDLQVDLPDAYRFGEPYLALLVLALDEHEPYGAALVDAEEFRFFISAPAISPVEGDGGALGSGFFREVDLRPSGLYPISGGSTDMDPAGRTQQANRHRFFKEAGKATQKLAFQNNVRHLILAGTQERLTEFKEALPRPVLDRVVAEDHAPTKAPDGEVLERLEAVVERSEREREDQLIEQVRESGVRGIKDTVEALQEGRVYHVVTLWNLDAEIRWCDHDELAITEVAREECPYCGRETRMRPLVDVIVDLAAARDARLEFVPPRDPVVGTPNEDAERQRERESAADVLREEFEGLAGLLRY